MGKYKEIQIEVSDEVYSALEQLADDLNKAETIILNRIGKTGTDRSEKYDCGAYRTSGNRNICSQYREKENARNRIRWDIQSKGEKDERAWNRSKNDRRTGETS